MQFWVGKFGRKQGGKVLRPTRHPDWASCAFFRRARRMRRRTLRKSKKYPVCDLKKIRAEKNQTPKSKMVDPKVK